TKLEREIGSVVFNGLSGDLDRSLYTVLNVGFSDFENDSMFLFNMDINGVAVSGGSACSSGSNQGSHVIRVINDAAYHVVRFTFGKDNTKQELDRVIEMLVESKLKKVAS